MSKLPLMLLIAGILIASTVALTILPANALTKRDFSYGFNDNHITARLGNSQVCGDHLCAPGEWDKLQASLTAAQLGHQGGRNATQTATVPGMSNATTAAPSVPVSVCESIKNTLNGAGVSSSLTAKVMADLGCS